MSNISSVSVIVRSTYHILNSTHEQSIAWKLKFCFKKHNTLPGNRQEGIKIDKPRVPCGIFVCFTPPVCL